MPLTYKEIMEMRKLVMLACAGLVLSCTGNVWAAISLHDDVTISLTPTQSGIGGPFKMDFYEDTRAIPNPQPDVSGWVNNANPTPGNFIQSFFTFCVEHGNTFSPG